MRYLPPAMGHTQRAGYYATQGAAKLGDLMSQMRSLDVQGSADVLLGNDFNTQRRLQNELGKAMGAPAHFMKDPIKATAFRQGAMRAAKSGVAKTALRFAPITAAGFALGDVASLVTDDVSLGNKAMDATAMAVGGALGTVVGGGPIGTAAGISTGKFLSDTAQAIFGGGKSREQQEQEQLYKLLLSRGL